MRPSSNRAFRIERNGQGPSRGTHAQSQNGTGGEAQARHEEVMSALGDIRARLASHDDASRELADKCQRDLREAQKFKEELTRIHDAITRTKQEIANLHHGERSGVDLSRMTGELAAIIEGTEQATETILHAAEQIDAHAGELAPAPGAPAGRDAASGIQEQVVKIFEACNFQDLTGQRITRVVAAFGFIEQRVERMMQIWGGLESFRDIAPDATAARNGDASYLNGPALESDAGIASQDDIDALFD